jgi:hypothetical protein
VYIESVQVSRNTYEDLGRERQVRVGRVGVTGSARGRDRDGGSCVLEELHAGCVV